MTKNYYTILEVEKTATHDEIKRQYKKLAFQYHPDKSSQENKELSTEKFKEISEAYHVLSDSTRRQEYDLSMNRSMNPGVHVFRFTGTNHTRVFSGQDAFNLFMHMFGGQRIVNDILVRNFGTVHVNPLNPFKGTYTPPKPKQRTSMNTISVEPVVVKLECDIVEMYKGCTREVEYTRMTPSGPQIVKQSIRINKHVSPGDRITIQGVGHQYGDGDPVGILVVELVEKYKGDKLLRQGNDIVFTHDISLRDSLLGLHISFTHLNGMDINFDMKGMVIPHGLEKRVLEQGFQSNDKIPMTGDLVIRFNVIYPESLTEKQRLAIQENF